MSLKGSWVVDHRRMIVTLHTDGLRTLHDVRDFLDGSRQIDLNVPNQAAAYGFIEHILGQFDYVHQGKAEKGLLRAGVDGFAHTVRDRDIDEEYMALVREDPDVWTIPNLPGSPVRLDDLPWLSDTVPPFEVENLRAQAERLEAEGPDDLFELQCRNLARNREAGMIIGMGTDSGVSVAWTTHTELRDMAGCGLTPMEVIEAENVQ